MLTAVRFCAALSLLFLPGAWLAFGLPLHGASVRARAALAVMLSPMIVVPLFYALRFAGCSFEQTSIALPIFGVPALWLIARRLGGVRMPEARGVLLWASLLLLPAAYFGLWMGDPQIRANHGHAWTHADIVYLLANGELRPEEPLLAGVRLAYPWLGHVFQAPISFLLDRAPSASYLLTNIVWLLAAIVLVAEVVARLGGGRLAQAGVASWLCFAVNVVGRGVRRLAPHALVARYPVWGDARYSPWIRKFGVFEQTMFGIGLFAAALYVLTRSGDEASDWSSLLVAALLLLSAALLYPVLFPATAALVGARVAILLARRLRGRDIPWREVGALGAALLVSGALGAAYVRFVSADHAGAATLGLSAAYDVRIKTATMAVVLAPLVAGVVLVGRALWRERPELTALLVLGAFASLVLHSFLDIYYNANEYKFVFTAAVCLTPFAVLALSRARRAFGRTGWIIAYGVTLALPIPALLRAHVEGNDYGNAPSLDVSRFALRLAEREPMAAMAEAIRTSTPANAVLVSRVVPFDLVTVTSRAMYVGPASREILHGIGLVSDYLLKQSRGYSAALIDERRATADALYAATDGAERERRIGEMLDTLHRPIVLIVDRRKGALLHEWLARRANTHLVFSSADLSAWRIDAPAAVLATRPSEPRPHLRP